MYIYFFCISPFFENFPFFFFEKRLKRIRIELKLFCIHVHVRKKKCDIIFAFVNPLKIFVLSNRCKHGFGFP